MLKKERGSVAIEAVLSISVLMILMVMLFGTLLSVYLDEESHWIAMQATEDMGLYAMPFIGHERIIQEAVNAFLLSELTVISLNHHIEAHGLTPLIKLHPDTVVTFSDYGFAELTFKYRFKLLAIDSENEIVLPMSAAVTSDGNDFSDDLVFITTYGEKYHKATCFHLRKSKFGISLTSAIEKGYEACKNCHGKNPIFQ